MMVPDGQFEGKVEAITVTPQRIAAKQFEEKYGSAEVKTQLRAARVAYGELPSVRAHARETCAGCADRLQGYGDYRDERSVVPRRTDFVLRRAKQKVVSDAPKA